jgi:hypothetical protein
MVGPRDKELTPLTRAQLDFASAMVDSYARGTKFLVPVLGTAGDSGNRSRGCSGRSAAGLLAKTEGNVRGSRDPDLNLEVVSFPAGALPPAEAIHPWIQAAFGPDCIRQHEVV